MTWSAGSRNHDGSVSALVRSRISAGHRLESGSVWLVVRPPGVTAPDDGWKLHVSARTSNYLAVLEAALPVVLEAGCLFKVARSPQVLGELNDGITAPASVGKAMTVYPDAAVVRDLGLALAAALHGFEGPRVLSDRRVDPAAPVYYRFGPFMYRAPVVDDHGRFDDTLHGPDGARFEAKATLRYRQPSWATDPFTGTPGRGESTGASTTRIGDRYRVTGGIREAAQGNVYRAVDEHDADRAVVIKQARPFVAETGDNDARTRLRNERRILTVLSGTEGVPAFVDHFTQADDEFLVTEDRGAATLAADVRAHGLWPLHAADSGRDLPTLATRLARIVADIHRHQVVIRDLTPGNVVIDHDPAAPGRDIEVSVIDFGLSAHDGLHLPGGTPGYAPARQARDEPPRDTDDLHSLGMTLWYAAGGVHPVTLGLHDDAPRLRALEAITAAHGPDPAGVIVEVAALIGDDEPAARRAFDRLRAGTPTPPPPVRPRRERGPDPDLLATITVSQRATLLAEADRLLSRPDDDIGPNDVNVYGGAAGMGLELLHHRDHDGVADRVADLVEFANRHAHRLRLPPGWFTGATGVALLWREAAEHGLAARAAPPWPDRAPAGPDVISGAAGVGSAHLRLYRLTGDPAHLDAARRCRTGLTALPAQAQDVPSVDPSAGYAHGHAGIVGFLVALAAQTAAPQDVTAARDASSRLAARAEILREHAALPPARPIAASWCQGLAGIGRTLLRAGAVLDDDELTAAAVRITGTVRALLPRMSALGQCCGASGVGVFLIEAERTAGADPAGAEAAAHLLRRSAGPVGHPVFVEPTADTTAASWSRGTAGVLAFLRLLTDPAAPVSELVAGL